MSTFKKSFAYAESLFRIMDSLDEGLAPLQICETFDWTFPGGTFGEREEGELECPHEELPTSGTVIPGGSMKSWVPYMESRKDNGYRGLELYPPVIRNFLKRRRSLFSVNLRSKSSWSSVAQRLYEGSSTVHFGMTAVYALSYAVMAQATARENCRVPVTSDVKAASREMYLGGSASAGLSMADLSIIQDIFHEVISKLGVPYLTSAIAKLETTLARATKCKSTPDEVDIYDAIAENDGFLEDDLDWKFREHVIIGATALEIRPKCVLWKYGATGYCLGMSDMRKVIALIIGVRNYLVGICSDAATSYQSRGTALLRSADGVRKHVTRICKLGASLENGTHLELCKAYKASLAIVKANIAGPMSTRYIPDLREDLSELAIYEVIKRDVEEFIEDCNYLPPTGSLPLAKIFRLLPPPDVWIHDALRERWLESSVIRNVGPEKCATFTTALNEVIMTAIMRDKSKRLTLRPGVARPAWWSAYLDRRYDDVPTDQLFDTCESASIVDVVDRSRYDPTVWKDSGCGADSLEEAEDASTPRYKKNFLMRMLYDSGCPMPETDVNEGQGIAQAGLKGESHKKRIFYSNNVASRLLQSKCDATVGEAMSSHPSFSIQKTGVERDDIFNDLSSPPNEEEFLRITGISTLVCALFYSFDIKGWSASMPGDIQKASHAVWDHFTGTDLFSRTSRNHDGAIVYCIQDGLTSWYTNGTANFEGYNGKEMTALHIAIMIVAVRELRVRVPDIDPRMLSITLQAYIDDGLARLVLPRATAMRVFNIWCDVVVEAWAGFGFTIERKKSFPSPAYFEFLGEEYFAGAHLATGSKAAMRITAEPFEIYESLRDRVTKLSTACRGACVAGLPPPSAYLLQSYMVTLEVRKWVRIGNPAAIACWLLAPVAVGGAGMPSLFQQATNASGATTEECINTLWYWAQSNVSVRGAYIAIIRRGMVPRTAPDVLSVPLGGQFDRKVLRQNPIGSYIISSLERHYDSGRLSELGALMMEIGKSSQDTSFQEAVVSLQPGSIYQEALLVDLSDPMPAKIFRSFIARFESARTIGAFVRGKTMREVVRKNKTEARASLNTFMRATDLVSGGDAVTRVGSVLRRGVDTSVI